MQPSQTSHTALSYSDPPTPVHPKEPKCESECDVPTCDPSRGFSVTTCAVPGCFYSDVIFRHSGWASTRQLVWQALHDADVPSSRLVRFENCGGNAWVIQDDSNPDRLRLVADYCHDRFCIPCGLNRARVIANNIGELIADEPHRFITLTLRSSDRPLDLAISHLYASFHRLRTSNLWQDLVAGGAAFLEVTWSETQDSWHPHLHIICKGKYIPREELKAAWLKATGDSFIIDIRLIRNRDKTIAYLLKYATKPLHPSVLSDPARLCLYVQSLTGRRFCTTFGTWRGISLTKVRDDTQWVRVASLSELRIRASRGDLESLQLLWKVLSHPEWLLVATDEPGSLSDMPPPLSEPIPGLVTDGPVFDAEWYDRMPRFGVPG